MLPPLVNEKEHPEELLIAKLKQCCVTVKRKVGYYDEFGQELLDETNLEVKMKTLTEINQYIGSNDNCYTISLFNRIILLVTTNCFRKKAITCREVSLFGTEDEEFVVVDPHWNYVELVYSIFYRMILSPQLTSEVITKLLSESFYINLCEQLKSDIIQERTIIKFIIHKLYLRFIVLRPVLKEVLIDFMYDYQQTNVLYNGKNEYGLTEILEIFSTIIGGYVIPINPKHVSLLFKCIMPLHKMSKVRLFKKELFECLFKYCQKDLTLTIQIIDYLLKCFPNTNPIKTWFILDEMKQFMIITPSVSFQNPIMCNAVSIIMKCFTIEHVKTVAKALSFFENQKILLSIFTFMPEAIGPLTRHIDYILRAEWDRSITDKAFDIKRSLMCMDSTRNPFGSVLELNVKTSKTNNKVKKNGNVSNKTQNRVDGDWDFSCPSIHDQCSDSGSNTSVGSNSCSSGNNSMSEVNFSSQNSSKLHGNSVSFNKKQNICPSPINASIILKKGNYGHNNKLSNSRTNDSFGSVSGSQYTATTTPSSPLSSEDSQGNQIYFRTNKFKEIKEEEYKSFWENTLKESKANISKLEQGLSSNNPSETSENDGEQSSMNSRLYTMLKNEAHYHLKYANSPSLKDYNIENKDPINIHNRYLDFLYNYIMSVKDSVINQEDMVLESEKVISKKVYPVVESRNRTDMTLKNISTLSPLNPTKSNYKKGSEKKELNTSRPDQTKRMNPDNIKKDQIIDDRTRDISNISCNSNFGNDINMVVDVRLNYTNVPKNADGKKHSHEKVHSYSSSEISESNVTNSYTSYSYNKNIPRDNSAPPARSSAERSQRVSSLPRKKTRPVKEQQRKCKDSQDIMY